MASSSSNNSGVPPGFRFHPTDEELLLHYLKKKVAFEKFDLEVIRDVDLNKVEPWELQERCKIGSAPQNEWYFFSHKDRKYPTGSRTNRATNAGFWKATGRDKCIRTSYSKIGMRKTLVFYRGRAPHGQKTDWIMHEYRLEDADEDGQSDGIEEGWVVCRVFKKKCFFKLGIEGNSTNPAMEMHLTTPLLGHEQTLALSSHFIQPTHNNLHHHLCYNNNYTPNIPPSPYSQVQVQDLLTNHRGPSPSARYDFSVIPNETINLDQSMNGWTTIDGGVDTRFDTEATAQQLNQMSSQHGSDMELWGYGK